MSNTLKPLESKPHFRLSPLKHFRKLGNVLAYCTSYLPCMTLILNFTQVKSSYKLLIEMNLTIHRVSPKMSNYTKHHTQHFKQRKTKFTTFSNFS